METKDELLEMTANSLEEARDKVRDIFDRKSSTPIAIIHKEDYEKNGGGERENSDNHLQEERLNNGESQVVPIIHHKYSIGEKRNEYYKASLKHKDGSELVDYFMIVPDLE